MQPGNQKQTNPQPAPKGQNHDPVASGPNSVPNTKPAEPSRTVPGHPPQVKTIRTGHRKETTGRYLLIFHP